MHVLYGLIDPRSRRVFHVGCTRESQPEVSKLNGLPSPAAIRVDELKPDSPQLVILQSVDAHPKAEWVKWSMRFSRDLIAQDWQQYRDLAALFTNSKRTRRFLGDEIASDADQQDFLDFDGSHPEVYEELLALVFEDFLAHGKSVPGMDTLIGLIRSEHKQSIRNAFKAYYARKLLMENPRLLGEITIVPGVPADDLVLADGRSWREFAAEHLEDLQFAAPNGEDEEDQDWTY